VLRYIITIIYKYAVVIVVTMEVIKMAPRSCLTSTHAWCGVIDELVIGLIVMILIVTKGDNVEE
jgi:hypothetical protein